MAAAFTGLLGTAAVANAATADPGAEEPGSTPAQQTSAAADASTTNDAGVGQAAGQAQTSSTSDQPQQAEPAQSEPSGAQEATVEQNADANADAKLDKPKNENAAAHVGASGAEDGHGANQQNKGEADAEASASADVSQQGNDKKASGDQAANAGARADVAEPSNSTVTARIEAPGHDAAFDQSNEADAKAKAKANADGADVDQKANAKADAKLDRPSNVAVELRVESDGNSAGGSQANAANADASVEADPNALTDADASASILNPTNTFVSIRINSEGTTGPVAQSNSATQSETVNGVTVITTTPDHLDSAWIAADPSSGVAITLITDGSNTDLRVAVNDVTLALPSSAPVFVWTWDMVFGADPISCEIDSSATAEQVSWTFDCDPGNEIVRTGAPATSSTDPGTIAWSWSWDRPELPGWSWDRYDVLAMALAACNCRFVIDFRWISREPTAPAAPQPAQLPVESAQAAVSQSNEATATAVATATVGVEQLLIQSGDLSSESIQSFLQQSTVVQVVSAISVAQLLSPVNTANGLLAVFQSTSVAAEARQQVDATILQHAAQQQVGADSIQVQVAVQVAVATQRVSALAVAASAHALNSATGRGAANQSVITKSMSSGHASSTTRQFLEQAQQGDRSSQEQLAGQWTYVVQIQELVSAAVLSRSVNDARLAGDGITQSTFAGATTRGLSTATVQQAALQLQVGDDALQFQEAYQLVDLTQEGEALAAASAGGLHRYVTPRAVAAPPDRALFSAPSAAAALPTGSLPVFSVGSIAAGLLGPAPARLGKPGAVRPRAVRPVRSVASSTRAPLRSAAFFFSSSQISASRAGSTGTALKRARDVGRPSSGSPRRRGTAPLSIGATTFGSSGTGTGGAQAALSRYVLLWVPGLGPRVFSPAGRRPADVRFVLKNPG